MYMKVLRQLTELFKVLTLLWAWMLLAQLAVPAKFVHGIDLGPGLSQTDGDATDQCERESDCDNDFDSILDEQPAGNYKHLLYPEWVHIGVVACGDRQPETTVAVKAILATTSSHVFVHIFTEGELRASFHKEFASWPEDIRSKFKYKLYPITYPSGSFDEWKKLFKKCATQRLFIPLLLRDVDSLLYIDTDILVMRPVEHIWAHFDRFNSSQLAAVAPEHESPNAGWYNRFARHPYYGRLGINSGVMLMNLTRIRAFPWLEHISDYFQTYKLNITWGDQDLLNILFHYYPEFVYTYECDWNYRPDHCMYMSVCKPAETHGISVLHGNRGVLHNDKHPQFKAVYDAFSQYQFEGLRQLLESMESKLDALDGTDGRCQAVKELFTKQFRIHI